MVIKTRWPERIRHARWNLYQKKSHV